MKKIFLLVLSLSLFISCSDDDDAGGNDDILGTWHLAEVNGTGNLPFEVNECTTRSNITFNSDNTAYSEYYAESDDVCESDAEEGTWSNEGQSKYSFSIPILGRQQGNVNFTGDSQFTFEPDVLPGISIVFEKR
ncbi:lipocalin family protein [Zunongwangia sp. H14]|uniref:lipocalin family protein n=1 Tax=Zunongwangia sp. H14 TaxID=3240792 RepID=UPI0035689611